MRRVEPLNLDLVLVLSCLSKIERRLHRQPRLRSAAECFGKTDGHLGADSGLLVHQVVERLPSHAERLGARRDAEVQRLETVLADNATRMNRIFQSQRAVLVLDA